LNLQHNRIYLGLYPRLVAFARDNDYTISSPSDVLELSNIVYDPDLVPTTFKIRDYQQEAVEHALKYKRCILESPTASGKSFIIYNIIKHIQAPTLLIVPTINLVHQMASDFVDYGEDPSNIHKIVSGSERESSRMIYVSTWQSIFRLPKEWFDRFEVVIGDEAHGYTATSLISIMEKCTGVSWRIGTTGTVCNEDSKVNILTLEGLFGKVKKVVSTKELMDQNFLSKFKIKALVLRYNKQEFKKDVNAYIADNPSAKNMNYQEQSDFIVRLEKRNKFIVNLALSLKGNTLVLFQYVDKHGKVLYDMIQKKNDGSKVVHYVSGSVKGEDREDVRAVCATSNDNIIVASFGVFSTGVNIPSINNIIFASSYKSKIKVLQSIGRSLRLHESKDVATLYDIVDDCSFNGKKSYSAGHFLERVKIYNQEKFQFKAINIEM
jgi:superfamily II DNA or RNA helicase